MNSSVSLRRVIVALSTLVIVAGASAGGCSSSKTCSADQVKACDDALSKCIATAPCDNALDPGFQACVDACKKKNCDCQTACGNTCTQS